MEAMRAARCVDFVEEMSNGMNTIMGERGVKLSPASGSVSRLHGPF
jgi:ABC-type multidrug transport system fused ATPase/permease subunit